MSLFSNAIQRRSIMLGLAFAMLAITTIGVGGIATSVLVAERIQGSGSAINVAGSLRKQSHRMGSQVLADAANGATTHGALLVAMNQFEASLADASLRNAMARDPDSDHAVTYRQVQDIWLTRLKPMLVEEALPGVDLHPVAHHNELLALIDSFVDTINTMVAQLEKDTEAKISHMRAILGAALFLIVIVLVSAMYVVHRNVLAPMAQLLANARRYAKGDFDARVASPREDELGQLGAAFNTMAEELSKLYRSLEQRVAEKTVALTRSNQSLELLYNAISRLHKAPVAPETYQAMLKEIEQVLGLSGSLACLMPNYGGSATLLASSLGGCADQDQGQCAACIASLERVELWEYRTSEQGEILVVPLRDTEGLYGVLRLALPPGNRLEAWQEQLLEALSRHIGVALGISHKTEQERLLALQEERSVIARELHDSLAQSLAYMKIQVSRLQLALKDPEKRPEADQILLELREGMSGAYRQLRELLTTFRLKMEGQDLASALRQTVAEFADRGGLEIGLDLALDGCPLTPNEEIHVLHVVREALSNVLNHARASHADVRLALRPDGELEVAVEDDGVGVAKSADLHHYGMTIMEERARTLAGHIAIAPRAPRGTRVALVFRPHGRRNDNIHPLRRSQA